ncbi:unnamed protein product [Eruca vesicaria subsp. sativa]|uniref:Uncharacterized protein n=1 Tax=Eruca vesicaria subsp. sativa TaxID=29727 RepID=A0ABC8L047_ERUVS|nr:unnamed protein product [Eruca vesicaria subsp. sativa]
MCLCVGSAEMVRRPTARNMLGDGIISPSILFNVIETNVYEDLKRCISRCFSQTLSHRWRFGKLHFNGRERSTVVVSQKPRCIVFRDLAVYEHLHHPSQFLLLVQPSSRGCPICIRGVD